MNPIPFLIFGVWVALCLSMLGFCLVWWLKVQRGIMDSAARAKYARSFELWRRAIKYYFWGTLVLVLLLGALREALRHE